MSADKPEQHWTAAYVDGDERRSWTEDEPRESLKAIGCAEGLPARAAIIDVGGGSSRLAARLLDDGHDVTVLDISDPALALAQRRLGPRAVHVRWLTADLLTWAPDRTYDLWHDRAVLHFFTEPNERQRYAAIAAGAVAPGGYTVIGTFAPGGPQRCSGLVVQQSDDHELAELLAPYFTPLRSWTHDHHTPAGVLQRFTWMLAQRQLDSQAACSSRSAPVGSSSTSTATIEPSSR